MNLKSILMGAAAVAALASCQTGNRSNPTLTNELDSTSYALGVIIGESNKMQMAQVPGADDLNKDILVAAFEKQLKGDSSVVITPQEAQNILQNYFQSVASKEADANSKAGEEFLAENGKRSEVTTTESGLQYEVLVEGTGEKPTLESTVLCHYHGTLIDGTVFDSSVDRGEPIDFPVKGVIRGWTEALQLMPVGSKWKLYIPSELAYGSQGTQGAIGPNATLIFEVELLEIVK